MSLQMRLIARRDTSLAIALIAGALIAFERPFRWLLDLTHDVEQHYQIDLLPALALLVAVFVFHQYKKRLQTKVALTVLGAEMADARARTEELERLIALGRALGQAADRKVLGEVLSRSMPQFVGDRECSILWRQPAGVDVLLADTRMEQRRSPDALAALVPPSAATGDAAPEGRDLDDGEDVSVPMVIGRETVGAIVVHNHPPMSPQARIALSAAGALIAGAARNVRLLQDARQSSTRDDLTGCVTRAYALDVLQAELRRADRTKRPVSVIMFDVDDFKAVNDRGGHQLGDAVLASVGVQLSEILRTTDLRCRYGGDEFLLVLPDTPVLGAQQVAELLRREIAAAPRDPDGQVFVTASLGVASAQPGEVDATAIIGRADEALYRAKRAGRNRHCVTANPTQTATSPTAPQRIHGELTRRAPFPPSLAREVHAISP